jgi:hypothetical protein
MKSILLRPNSRRKRKLFVNGGIVMIMGGGGV